MDKYGRRFQELILVLQALWDLGGRNEKREVIAHINRSKYIEIRSCDLPAYRGTNEPKYHTLLAWARKDAALADCIFADERNSWGITRRGRELLDRLSELCIDGRYDVRKCYLWSPTFKQIFNPQYLPSDADILHPDDKREKRIQALNEMLDSF